MIYQCDEAHLVATSVLDLLRAHGLTLATCESLTGGMIGATLTAVPGSSDVFRGGLITYHSDLKVSLAEVDQQLVATQGVVNAQTARQMAVGAASQCGADVALSVTGVAGPGPSGEIPAGMVWMGLCLPNHWPDPIRSQELRLSGDRSAIRRQTVLSSLRWLVDVVSES